MTSVEQSNFAPSGGAIMMNEAATALFANSTFTGTS